jgi:phosphoglycerol transferase MdoB-like AlkP superfamily enzyme
MIFIVLFTFFRLVTFAVFAPEAPAQEWLPSFILGLRFDLRWISLLLLPIVLGSLYPRFAPFSSERNKRFWTWYLAVVTFIIFFFFAADYGCFSYNKTRLNASALNFAEDPGISLQMLWQSYPLFWFLLLLFLAVLLLRWLFYKTHVYIIRQAAENSTPSARNWLLGVLLALGLLIYGSAGLQPLKWNNAFTLQDSFKSYLALNPLQSFFATLKFRKPQHNESSARRYFGQMAALLNLPPQPFSYKRTVLPGANALATKPNVVLVLCESFSMYKSSMSGNPLGTTPYFDSLSRNGIFFERCFSPHFSTARGLFATLTGIPDVQLSKFSTRNPQALNQHTIINDFKGYNKFYFLGGNPSFNNFEGLLQNVDSLQMITEGKFGQKPVNVWGISDNDLFSEAHKVFTRQTAPFFAIVQTADNHRPFMIPERDTDFKKEFLPRDTLARYGFESVEEYNSFRYADYCFRNFMETASKEPYFDNTIFVFVGDHGVSGNATAVYPQVWTREQLTDEHVPLLFYAPRLLKAQRRTEVVSQIDVLPTVAALAGQRYTNTTLGRDLLSGNKGPHYAFTIQHDKGRIGLLTDSFYFTKNLNFHQEELHALAPHATITDSAALQQRLSSLTTAYYETAKWMLLNNKKEAAATETAFPQN